MFQPSLSLVSHIIWSETWCACSLQFLGDASRSVQTVAGSGLSAAVSKRMFVVKCCVWFGVCFTDLCKINNELEFVSVLLNGEVFFFFVKSVKYIT